MKVAIIIATLALGVVNLSAQIQDHWNDESPLSQLIATQSINSSDNPAAQHTVGETEAHFAEAEPSIADRKICFIENPEKSKKCSQVLQGGNGVVRFRGTGILSEESRGFSIYRFYTQYKFENGVLVEIALASDNGFSEVVNDFSARFGQPSKTWTETSQNANGAKFDLGNASWDLPDGARALVTENVLFIVPPNWANRKGTLPKGLVHTTNAVIMSATELAKRTPVQHVKF